MRRQVLTRVAALGSLLALAACADADTIAGNDAGQLVTTASTSVLEGEPGYAKASMFGTPREARIRFW